MRMPAIATSGCPAETTPWVPETTGRVVARSAVWCSISCTRGTCWVIGLASSSRRANFQDSMLAGLGDVEDAARVQRDALGVDEAGGDARHRAVRRHAEDLSAEEAAAHVDGAIRACHHVDPIVLAARQSDERRERAVARQAVDLARRAQE